MNVIIFVILAVLNLADILLTVRILKQGGREMNPVMARFMAALGVVPALVVAKAIVLAAAWFVLVPAEGASIVLWGLCVLYVVVVAHNAGQLKAAG